MKRKRRGRCPSRSCDVILEYIHFVLRFGVFEETIRGNGPVGEEG